MTVTNTDDKYSGRWINSRAAAVFSHYAQAVHSAKTIIFSTEADWCDPGLVCWLKIHLPITSKHSVSALSISGGFPYLISGQKDWHPLLCYLYFQVVYHCRKLVRRHWSVQFNHDCVAAYSRQCRALYDKTELPPECRGSLVIIVKYVAVSCSKQPAESIKEQEERRGQARDGVWLDFSSSRS